MIRLNYLEISMMSCFYIGLVLLVRKTLNNKSFKYASIILWGLIALRLIFPYSIWVPLEKINREGAFYQDMNSLIDFMTGLDKFKRIYIMDNIDLFFPKINRLIVILLIGAYMVFRIIRATRTISHSSIIQDDEYIDEFLKENKLKRKVQVLINDGLKYPITYGIIEPKIIIQSELMEDRDMLKYILTHEMIHIKKFDILFNYLRYILICMYWYNPLVWAMVVCLDKDIEILCDKLVIDKFGNSEEDKKNYCITMFNLTNGDVRRSLVGVGLHPSLERMIVLKNWKVKKSGAFLGILMLCIVGTTFVSAAEHTLPVTTCIDGCENEVERVVNVDNRTREITDEEYDELYREDDHDIKIMKVDISDSATIDALGGSESYTFNMNSWTGPPHKKFVTNIENTSSSGGIDFKLIIEEDGEIIYSKSYDKDIRIVTNNAKENREYIVTIVNTSNKALSYDISIVSYR